MAEKNRNSTPEDYVHIPTIQISQKEKEIKNRLSWSIEHTINCPAVMP